jgi:L-threonylcarbamoyladenylate synthase
MNKNVASAIEILDQSGVIGLPTETVYGLAARIDRRSGLESIFRIKQRPFFDPLIVHVFDQAQAQACTSDWSPAATHLAQTFWPGPLTLVLKKAAHVDHLITSGLETVALRCPSHPIALEIIKQTGPLAAPSANKFGKTSPTCADHVQREFNNQVYTVDGGPCNVGIESTIIHLENINNIYQIAILRSGKITYSQIESSLKKSGFTCQRITQIEDRIAPGNMKHHYMPAIPLFLIKTKSLKPHEVLSRARQKLPQLSKPTTLLLSEDVALACREVYAKLRELSESGADHIVCAISESWHTEDWAGLRDRLHKAAYDIL